MALTFLQLKQLVRSRCFPAGEARNLRPSHDKSMLDCLVDLQRWVDCLQSNNTHLVPHCATFYKCGLTSFDFPRSIVRGLSVIDKINPTTHKEDPTAADDYCTEIEYAQIDVCHMHNYIAKSRTIGCCFSCSSFFALPQHLCGWKGRAPIPTDEGVPAGLPTLSLGYHYPQESTDAVCGRSRAGVWAIESGRIYVAPWIQSTETIVLKWQGIKRDWVDADLVDDDPTLIRAVELFLRWEHSRDWDRDGKAAEYENEYRKALSELIYDCAKENEVRDCGTERGFGAAGARGITPTVKLYFNDALPPVTEYCPQNETGSPVTEPIAAGTVSSTVSVSDANARAVEEARARARARLDCTAVSGGGNGNGGTPEPSPCPGNVGTWQYPVTLTATVHCTDYWVPSGDADPPTGPATNVTLAACSGPKSTVGPADAEASARALFEQMKVDALRGQCTFYCKTTSAPGKCPGGITVYTATVAKGAFTSTGPNASQAEADSKALAQAQQDAAAYVAAHPELCASPPPKVFCSLEKALTHFRIVCPIPQTDQYHHLIYCALDVPVYAPAGAASGNSQKNADIARDALMLQAAQAQAEFYCPNRDLRQGCTAITVPNVVLPVVCISPP